MWERIRRAYAAASGVTDQFPQNITVLHGISSGLFVPAVQLFLQDLVQVGSAGFFRE